MQFVMIEGGATIIKHCLKYNILLDALVVTIAPTYIGKGVSICSQTQHSVRIQIICLLCMEPSY
jgi:riboflavin biosynthesis pyrimidine reductase